MMNSTTVIDLRNHDSIPGNYDGDCAYVEAGRWFADVIIHDDDGPALVTFGSAHSFKEVIDLINV